MGTGNLTRCAEGEERWITEDEQDRHQGQSAAFLGTSHHHQHDISLPKKDHLPAALPDSRSDVTTEVCRATTLQEGGGGTYAMDLHHAWMGLAKTVFILFAKTVVRNFHRRLLGGRVNIKCSRVICFLFYTGWSINNRTILNCSHFLARRFFFNLFSPKRSIHIGKLPQQHEFANASFVILFRCHFVSPCHVDGSANDALCRGGHFCEIAGVLAH